MYIMILILNKDSFNEQNKSALPLQWKKFPKSGIWCHDA